MNFGRTLVTGGSGFIGTNIIEALLERGADIVNVDKVKPKIARHDQFWRRLDIMDAEGLDQVFREFCPELVIHLAARVDNDGTTIEEYSENTIGTMNVIRAADAAGTVTRFIVTSTQFVIRAGYISKNDEDLAPYTVYGESKAEMERMVRAFPPAGATWTIVRPTNVWGPWHPRFPDQMWRYLARRWYLHPVLARPVIRSYAYVGTVVSQIIAALERPAELVHQRAFFVGDEPMPSEVWLDAFSFAFTNKPTRRFPFALLQFAGRCGDVLRLLRLPAPIWSERIFRMSSDYVVPMKPTFDALGAGPLTLEQGVEKSVTWLKSLGCNDF